MPENWPLLHFCTCQYLLGKTHALRSGSSWSCAFGFSSSSSALSARESKFVSDN